MVWLERRENRLRPDDSARSPGAVDYARVIHSASFRRLQGKTQILNLGDSDFYRTRLTHSLEVAQIAGGLVAQVRASFPAHPAAALLPEPSMIQAIACAHDLGHPPFGHGGEVALNYAMRDHGGFEGNGQTLRLLARLEAFSDHAGANLTRRSLLGVLKYPVRWSAAMNPELRPALTPGLSLNSVDVEASTPPKCYLDTEAYVVDWVLAPLSSADRDQFTALQPRSGQHARSLRKSLDCSIMDLADDIAYGVHDLEDAIALDLVGAADLAHAIRADEATALPDPSEPQPGCAGQPAGTDRVADRGRTAAEMGYRSSGKLLHHFGAIRPRSRFLRAAAAASRPPAAGSGGAARRAETLCSGPRDSQRHCSTAGV